MAPADDACSLVSTTDCNTPVSVVVPMREKSPASSPESDFWDRRAPFRSFR